MVASLTVLWFRIFNQMIHGFAEQVGGAVVEACVLHGSGVGPTIGVESGPRPTPPPGEGSCAVATSPNAKVIRPAMTYLRSFLIQSDLRLEPKRGDR